MSSSETVLVNIPKPSAPPANNNMLPKPSAPAEDEETKSEYPIWLVGNGVIFNVVLIIIFFQLIIQVKDNIVEPFIYFQF